MALTISRSAPGPMAAETPREVAASNKRRDRSLFIVMSGTGQMKDEEIEKRKETRCARKHAVLDILYM